MIVPVLADGLGTSADETVAQLMLFLAVALAITGVRAIRGRALRTKPRWLGPLLVAFALGLLPAAFTLPQRYLRPRIASVRPQTTAQLEIVAPREGEVVKARLRFTFRLEGARLLDQATTRLRPDEGHVHVDIDGTLLPLVGGTTREIDVSGLRPGAHVLNAELVAGDHGPFSPRVVRSVRFEVRR